MEKTDRADILLKYRELTVLTNLKFEENWCAWCG